MLNEALFDRSVRRSKRSRREELNEFPLSAKRRKKAELGFSVRNQSALVHGKSGSGQHGPGLFNNAKDFVVNQSTLIEHQSQIIQNYVAGTGE